jgi:mono/diheme cytochrome c family protein
MLMPAALLAQADLTGAQKEYFESRIRPVLAQQCFVCHTNSKAGGLRLDTREDILKGGKSGPALVPGDPDKSLIVSAIRHAGPLQMPKNAVKLTESQVKDFTQWVKDGAYWPAAEASKMVITERQKQRWSYLPLQPGTVPAVQDKAWPSNDIDRFVLARLEREGLKPGATADRRTLIRRVTYDLTGLPPTFEEVQAFETDKSPGAWEKVIDRLLASPRYGERWARHWMDVVRYGEDDYNVGQMPDRAERYPHAYLYRDWLINAFNDDIRYDTFVKAQLAADLMKEPKLIPALGMHGAGVWSFQDNPAPIERADEWHDKLDVTSKAFLGITVGCARCHDHKYDPIPTKDYYRLASVFASSKFHAYPQVPKAAWEAWEKQKQTLEEKEKAQKKFLEQASDLFAQSLLMQTKEYMTAAWLAGQKRSSVQSVADEKKLDAEILERWVRFLQKEPSNYSFLKPWQAMVARGGSEKEAGQLAGEFYEVVLDVQREFLKLKEENEVALAKFKLKDQVEDFDPLPNFKKRRLNKHQIDLKSLDRERQYLWRDVFETDLPANPGNPNAEEKKKPGLFKLTEWALERRLTGELAAHATRLKADLEAYKKAMPPEPPYVYGIAEAEPTTLRVFVRGNVYNFGEEAPRGFLSLFSNGDPQLFDKGSGRLELAEAILKQPVAMRVVVNRIWRWHMGTGIVDTPNNFGVLGASPTNQKLLDYLATRFEAGGLSWKKLHKEILLSKTYQLSAQTIEANAAKDPGNKLYWRANRRRLDAEGVWDTVLTASAKLDTSKLGGPSEDLGEAKMIRRGVYGRVSRMYPNDFLATFDAPAATISSEFRYMTNVPLQKLFFLNSEVVRRHARLAAERIAPVGASDAQVKRAYQIFFQRQPSSAELTFALDFLRQAEAMAAPPPEPTPAPNKSGVVAKPERSSAMAAEPAPPPPSANPTPLKPLDSLCWALMSSNEFLYVN